MSGSGRLFVQWSGVLFMLVFLLPAIGAEAAARSADVEHLNCKMKSQRDGENEFFTLEINYITKQVTHTLENRKSFRTEGENRQGRLNWEWEMDILPGVSIRSHFELDLSTLALTSVLIADDEDPAEVSTTRFVGQCFVRP